MNDNVEKKIKRKRKHRNGVLDRGGKRKKQQEEGKLQQGDFQAHLKDQAPKLTKQQKRDIKRNAKTKAVSSAPSTEIAINRDAPYPFTSNKKMGISAYKRETVYPETPRTNPPLSLSRGFITPTLHPKYYQDLLDTSYKGFVQTPCSSFDNSFHVKFQASLKGLGGRSDLRGW